MTGLTENSMATKMDALWLSDAHFETIRALVRSTAGIDLRDGKQALVRSRVQKRLRALGLPGFDAYMACLEADESGLELRAMIDVLTTNKTSFFRESAHYDYLRESLLPALAEQDRPLRIWSAGCSSGEEPFTIAMIVRSTLPRGAAARTRILATDISDTVLDRARAATYPVAALRDVPQSLQQYFRRRGDVVEVDPDVRRMVSFARLNLVEAWPMRGPFDAIFCRNVMIYFQRDTQGELVRRFWSLLGPAGHLFVGHSESLTGWDHGFQYVQPAVYRR